MNVHALLCEKMKEPWNCALTVVDWFNGSRNAPSDLSLTGSIHGMTLRTKPEDIYLGHAPGPGLRHGGEHRRLRGVRRAGEAYRGHRRHHGEETPS